MLLKQKLYNQLALDFSIPSEKLPLNENYFTMKKYLSGRRLYKGDDCILGILGIDNHIAVSCGDESLLEWLKAEFSNAAGEWISEYANIFKINNKLKEYGHYIFDAHHYYIPRENAEVLKPNFSVRWYEREDIPQFFSDKRFRTTYLRKMITDLICLLSRQLLTVRLRA